MEDGGWRMDYVSNRFIRIAREKKQRRATFMIKEYGNNIFLTETETILLLNYGYNDTLILIQFIYQMRQMISIIWIQLRPYHWGD